MNIDSKTHSVSPEIMQTQGSKSTNFFRKLDPETLERIEHISYLAASKISYPLEANSTTYSAKKGEDILKDQTAKKIALRTLGKEMRTIISDQEKSQEKIIPFKKFDWNQYQANIKDLNDFEKILGNLFGDSVLSPELKKSIVEIRNQYRAQYTAFIAGDKDAYKDAENEIHRLQEQISPQINRSLIESEKVNAKANEEVIAAGLIESLVGECRLRSLFNEASDTHQMMEDLKNVLTQQISSHGAEVKSKEMRRKLYGHVKHIQERTRDLVEIENNRRGAFKSLLHPFSKSELKRDYQDLKTLTDIYYKQFNFTEDEVDEFRDLSLETHQPKRQHLIMYASDILEGAQNEGEKIEQKLRDNLLKEIVKEDHPSTKEFFKGKGKILTNLIDRRYELDKELERFKSLKMENSETGKLMSKDLDRVKNQITQLKGDLSNQEEKTAIEQYEKAKSSPAEFQHAISLMNKKTTSPEFKKALQKYNQQMEAVKEYRWKIETFKREIKEHPHIGNNNPHENLSMNMKDWKEEQKLAKEAIQTIFDDLKVDYGTLVEKVEGHEITSKDAGTILKQARDDVIADKARWDKPAERFIEISFNNLPSKQGKTSFLHKMVCPNEGYPSSGFRGRTAGLNTHQPNLQDVTLADGDRVLGHYTSSATCVEFFLEGNKENSEARTKSTEHQVMETLLGKVDNRWSELSPEQKRTAGTRDHPIVLDVPVTHLLTPDTLRDWLKKNPNMQDIGGYLGANAEVNSSRLELRMLQESEKAWNSFDRETPRAQDETFRIMGKDGKVREVRVDVKDQETSYVITVKDEKGQEKEIYVQFDISCYNVGCNKWAKRMSNLFFGKGIEGVAKYGLKPLQLLGEIIRKPVQTYKGEKGNEVQDEMNRKSFEKDTKKYNRKCEQLLKEQEDLIQKDDPDIKKLAVEIGKEKIQFRINDISAQIERLKKENKETIELEQEYQRLVKIKNQILDIEGQGGDVTSILQKIYNEKISDYGSIAVRAKLRQGDRFTKIDNLLYGSVDSEGNYQDGIRQLRVKLLEAENKYHHATKESEISALDKERKSIFQAWQSKRDELAKLLDLEINVNKQKPADLKLLQLIKKEEDLRDIYNEVSDLLTFEEYRDPEYMKQNMYILPSALVALGCELGSDPHTGCRSGKDRTSIQRIEVGVRLLSKEAFGRHLNFREREQYPITSKIREEMMLNSGQIDHIAFLNTGGQGLNLTESYGSCLKDFGRNKYNYPRWFANIVSYGTKNVFVMNLK